MIILNNLHPLIDNRVNDEVLESLRSGKEASIYIVRCGVKVRCVNVYKDLGQRCFQHREQYQEGCRVPSLRWAAGREAADRESD